TELPTHHHGAKVFWVSHCVGKCWLVIASDETMTGKWCKSPILVGVNVLAKTNIFVLFIPGSTSCFPVVVCATCCPADAGERKRL
ncbi:MAG: hypothetical protein KDB85_11695, partial [Chitinophagales bacterium]|nr:hypothetical protein [Chitinophagales bacterium]